MTNSIRDWISRHRTATVIATTAVIAITGTAAILLIKGKTVEIPIDKLSGRLAPENPQSAETIAQTVAVEVDGVVKTFPRMAFVRHLHEGWKASPAKIAEAEALHIDLMPGETLVNACTVTVRVVA